MPKLKVLMAEDEPEVLEIMSRKVASEGYAVITARDGQEAWDKIQQESPDVIVLDLVMPKKNGFEVLRRLRDRPSPGRWQPVIIVSAKREMEDMKEGFDMEADHYIAKPCHVEDILKSIRIMADLIPQRKQASLNEGGNTA
jgi:DNA-binding response OmpR family regulator